MKAEDVSRMANQIADFFADYPEDEAAGLVADHIQKFWAPAMRADLARVVAEQGDAFRPLALKGAELVAAADRARQG